MFAWRGQLVLVITGVKAERMACWVEHHANVGLRLKRGLLRPEFDGVANSRVKVNDLEVEVHHHLLSPIDVRPCRPSVVL